MFQNSSKAAELYEKLQYEVKKTPRLAFSRTTNGLRRKNRLEVETFLDLQSKLGEH